MVSLPAGTTTVTLTVTDDDGAEGSLATEVIVVDFAARMEAAGLVGPEAGSDATPFGDGVANLLKDAFNMEPGGPDHRVMTAGGTAGLPSVRLEPAPGGGHQIRVEWLERIASGLNYRVLFLSDLQPGSAVLLEGDVVTTPVDQDWRRMVMTKPLDLGLLKKGFVQVEVALP